MHLENIVKSKGKKKILALDGGGIKGIITIEILAKMEKELRVKENDPNLILSDYFDLVAGTSTGALIAALICMGKSTDEIRDFYIENGNSMFHRASWLTKIGSKFGYIYNDKKLAQKLQEVVGETTTLGSDKLKTLLLIVMHNAKTDSPWPVSNNPQAKYNELVTNGKESNLHLPLWQLLRASTAAPIYFPPEEINISGEPFIFLDGGITPYNNPAFQAYIMSTLEQYNLNWNKGEENILLVSVGTGITTLIQPFLQLSQMNFFHQATKTISHVLNAVEYQQDMLCRVFGKCLVGHELDSEIGDLVNKEKSKEKKEFTYLRYNAQLDEKGLAKLNLSHLNPEDLKKLDAVDKIHLLQEVGKAVARDEFCIEHFEGF